MGDAFQNLPLIIFPIAHFDVKMVHILQHFYKFALFC